MSLKAVFSVLLRIERRVHNTCKSARRVHRHIVMASCIMHNTEATPRERSDRGRFFVYWKKGLFIAGCVEASIIELECTSVCCVLSCVSAELIVKALRDRQNKQTRCLSTQAGEHSANALELFRCTPCRVGRGRRVAVCLWCVLNAAGFRSSLRPRPTVCIRQPCLIYSSDNNEAVFCNETVLSLLATKHLHCEVHTGSH